MMSKQRLNASFEGKGIKGEISLELYVWEEDEDYYVYSPALDLIGDGDSEDEAKDSFQNVLEEYLRSTNEKGTLLEDLENHGWKIDRANNEIEAPKRETLLKENETLKQIVSSQQYHTENQAVALP